MCHPPTHIVGKTRGVEDERSLNVLNVCGETTHVQQNKVMVEIESLVARIKSLYESKAATGDRLIISLAGVPGSGKSTISEKLVQEVNRQFNGTICQAVSQDGYHLYRSQLLELPDPEEAVRRRGAPFTFNPTLFLQLVKNLRESDSTILAASFDHALKDPIEDSIEIGSSVRIIILEGLYVQLKDPIWTELADYVDEKWFIGIDLDKVRSRVVQRHVVTGVAPTVEEAQNRFDTSDLLNGQYILANSTNADLVINND